MFKMPELYQYGRDAVLIVLVVFGLPVALKALTYHLKMIVDAFTNDADQQRKLFRDEMTAARQAFAENLEGARQASTRNIERVLEEHRRRENDLLDRLMRDRSQEGGQGRVRT